MGYVILSDEIKDSTRRMIELFKKKSWNYFINRG
jgi:hypothetical protein